MRIRKMIVFGLWAGLIQCHSAPKAGSHYNQHNAIWTESVYFRGVQPSTGAQLTDAAIEVYAQRLRSSHIQYAYIFAGPFNEQGHLPAYAFSATAIHSVQALKKLYPELVVLPWIGGIQNKTVHLEDTAWVAAALQDTRQLVTVLQVPGVHLDFECILPDFAFIDTAVCTISPAGLAAYGSNVNAFHRQLRAALPASFISAVVTATSPGTRPWKRKTGMEELQELVRYVDQLVFLYYDTGIERQEDFRNNCDSLLRDIQQLKRLQGQTQYLVAIGTFLNPMPELQKHRYLQVENVPNSLQTIRQLLDKKNYSKRLIDGIALFCNWQTDEEEWKAFDDNWACQ